MLRYGWLTHRSGPGGWRFVVRDGNHSQGAYILTRVQVERLWAVVADGYPHLGAAGKCGASGHKRRQSILGTEVDVLRRPRVVA